MRFFLALALAVAPAVLAAPAAPPPAVTPDQYVTRAVSQHLTAATTSARRSLQAAIQSHFDDLQRHLRLDHARHQRLVIAATGAAEAALEPFVTDFTRTLQDQTKGATPDTISEILRNIGDRHPSTRSIERHPLWLTALRDTLTASELAAWVAIQQARDRERRAALTELTLAELEGILHLTSAQVEAIAPPLAAAVETYAPDFASVSNNGDRMDNLIAGVDAADSDDLPLVLLPLYLLAVPDAQRRALISKEQHLLLTEHTNEYKDQWEDIQRRHNHRLKGKVTRDKE